MAETIATPSAQVNGGAASSALLSVQHIEKVFGTKGNLTHALDGVSLDVAQGEFVAIMGPSGSGKTTLLNCISTIDRPSNGRILIKGQDITVLGSRALARFRREQLGFIFQDSNLLDTLTGYENIALALTIKGTPSSRIPALINDISHKLGVERSLQNYPNQMSGGQRQRVAAARAIVSDPSLILADEPTGALDSHNATVMLETLEHMNQDLNATILMVTHDAYAASFTNRVLFLSDGRIFNEIRRGALSREEYFGRIMEVVTFLGGEARHAV
jgi:putative ABC transport system ATP-binding protein